MSSNYLPIAIKNTGMSLEDIVPHLPKEEPKLQYYTYTCTLFRRLAAGELLITDNPKPFYKQLCHSANAFIYFLERAPEEEQAVSLALPFFDAIACGYEEGARRIAELSTNKLNPRKEYEEEFLYTRILMEHFYLQTDPKKIEERLEEFSGYSDDNYDPHYALCQALLDKDQVAFDEALKECIQKRLDDIEKIDADSMDPHVSAEAATTAHVSTEVLAWLILAERQGLTTSEEVSLAPSTARLLRLAELPQREEWKVVARYRSLT
ncbi:immunity 49 family protein [Hahella sp. CR1]|uniref:immunity 49 family protein n=1 Tax=Hahella sp. CR1 TaxID=2992807 RepID=UPI002441ECBE|nr:immunity 49 family protein [Hahella sp. CR1]MDG9669606.1 immunity 49 family protein [Hahella sp. CR1]